jgi:hypothetical protein
METKPSRRCLLVRPTVEDMRSEKTERSSDRNWDQRGPDQRRRASQVASSGRRYFGVIVVVIVNELFSKQLHLIQNPIISCHGTPDTWQYLTWDPLNTILPSTRNSPKWSRPFGFPTQNSYFSIISRECYVSHASHPYYVGWDTDWCYYPRFSPLGVGTELPAFQSETVANTAVGIIECNYTCT